MTPPARPCNLPNVFAVRPAALRCTANNPPPRAALDAALAGALKQEAHPSRP